MDDVVDGCLTRRVHSSSALATFRVREGQQSAAKMWLGLRLREMQRSLSGLEVRGDLKN